MLTRHFGAHGQEQHGGWEQEEGSWGAGGDHSQIQCDLGLSSLLGRAKGLPLLSSAEDTGTLRVCSAGKMDVHSF